MSAGTSLLTPTLPPVQNEADTELPLYRWTVEQYHKLIDSGTLNADDRVELLEGWLVRKMSKNPPHSNSNSRVGRFFQKALPEGWCYRMQEPVTLADSEPEPDCCVARGTIDDYVAVHPTPFKIGLVVEVANSTLSEDRGIKLRSYARAGIVCYWIVNLIDRQIEIYTEPDSTASTPSYMQREIISADQRLNLLLDGKLIADIAAGDLLPAAVDR